MKVSFQKLFTLLHERGLDRKDLVRMGGFSSATVFKMAHDKVVTSEVLGRTCEALGVPIEAIMEVIIDEDEKYDEELVD